MGFLDHSTNNIIVDAVLTDLGRKKLASATTAENFIETYAFADDEVDYTLIKKYGTIVGKEKIEKNTPIFEASTSAEFGVKSFLGTSSNPIVAQPILNTALGTTTLNKNNLQTVLTISLTDPNNILPNVAYDVFFDRRFLAPVNASNVRDIDGSANRRFFTIEANDGGERSVKFTRSALGEDFLKEQGKTATNTNIEIRTSTGDTNQQPVVVEYN